MSTTTVEISDDKLAKALLASEEVVTITQDGQPVGHYYPSHSHPKRREVDWDTLKQAHAEIQSQMAAAGITEEDIIADLERLHARR
jgi:hypothetical protein